MSKTVKYDASKIAERLRDHSLYIAFAPADKPKIALAVIVENAGFGAAAAAPIARLAIDYYLLGKRPDEPVTKVDARADSAVRPESDRPPAHRAEANKPPVAGGSVAPAGTATAPAVPAPTAPPKPVAVAAPATAVQAPRPAPRPAPAGTTLPVDERRVP
jgi:penicillin-binding protein 2